MFRSALDTDLGRAWQEALVEEDHGHAARVGLRGRAVRRDEQRTFVLLSRAKTRRAP